MAEPETTPKSETVAQKGPVAGGGAEASDGPGKAADAATPPAPPASDAKGEEIDALLREWVYGHIHNGPIARSSECYEALNAALPALRTALLGG